MKQEELRKILADHKKWLLNEGGRRANLSCADLREADLRCADLREADLRCADLRGADLREADLREADLSRANLSGADLRGADLSCADLYEANLRGANLREADLRGANLYEANLRGANLRGANLREADLRGADLSCADLRGANLYEANLRGADLRGADLRGADLREVNVDCLTIGYHLACPTEGSFIGYKKAAGKIVVLEIPADAKRSSATSAKCRCSKAKVLRIENLDGTPAEVTQVSSNFDENFIYKIGEIVEVPDFDDCRWNECSQGIHFFVNKDNAKNYN